MINDKSQAMPAYNCHQSPLLMPEYGRMVQKMVETAMQIPNKAQRQACAQYIIDVMARMLDSKMERPDFAHKLWNHLARISHYQLDIDYPVDIVPEMEVLRHPNPIKYPMKRIRRRHYGYLTEQMLNYLTHCSNPEEQQDLAVMAANHMRQNLYTWNRDAMSDDLVKQDFKSYTHEAVTLPENIRFAPVVQDDANLAPSKKGKKKKNKVWQPL